MKCLAREELKDQEGKTSRDSEIDRLTGFKGQEEIIILQIEYN